MAQQLVEKRGFANHDPMRTARMGGYGGSTFAPFSIRISMHKHNYATTLNITTRTYTNYAEQ